MHGQQNIKTLKHVKYFASILRDPLSNCQLFRMDFCNCFQFPQQNLGLVSSKSS